MNESIYLSILELPASIKERFARIKEETLDAL